MRYCVVIPTYQRDEELAETVRRTLGTAEPPEIVYVVNNNDDRRTLPVEGWQGVEVVFNRHEKLGPAQGKQTGLELATEAGMDICVTWDDDLWPVGDCIPQLVQLVGAADSVVAAGGLYPTTDRLNGPFVKWTDGNRYTVPDGRPEHLQFFLWEYNHGEVRLVVRRHHLYSSYAFNVKKANLVGGFFIGCSRRGFRHETDLSLRLNEVGGLYITQGAVAEHRCSFGGIRGVKDTTELARQDHELFARRMKSMGIDPDYQGK